ncbi:MAG: hypothetical protein M1479_08275 [Actinobacteria bacterium]|nr:hypothetical protein [Cyanobacteriota bacterium]MCL5772255.1 hypothetical protein [Actinomycetota bacterium]
MVKKYFLNNEDEEDFLKWFEFLLEYQKEVLISNDLNMVTDRLKETPGINKAVIRIFNKLIKKNLFKYYEMIIRWKNV